MSATWPALMALAAALAAWSPAGAQATSRARSMAATPARPRRENPARSRSLSALWQRRLLAGAAGCAVGVLVGGPAGALLAVAVGLAGERLLRTDRVADRERRAALEWELPAAGDLLAVCLAAGMPVGTAVAAVADAVGEPLAGVLRGVAGLYRLGAEPRRAWSGVPEEVLPLARVLVRAGESGSAVGPALHSLAADGRAVARGRIEADVRKAGVWVLAPLGLCFLPAFVCLGVVPLVLGIAGEVFR